MMNKNRSKYVFFRSLVWILKAILGLALLALPLSEKFQHKSLFLVLKTKIYLNFPIL